MRDLKFNEVQEVNGAGWLGDLWDDARRIINELPDAYEDAINSTTDMMCTGTGNC